MKTSSLLIWPSSCLHPVVILVAGGGNNPEVLSPGSGSYCNSFPTEPLSLLFVSHYQIGLRPTLTILLYTAEILELGELRLQL